MTAKKLIRGGNTGLSDLMPTLGTVVVGFGWRILESRGPQVELVPAAIICDSSGRALSDEHMVFFNQLAAPDGTVQYVEGDEEQIEVNLPSIPPEVDKIVFVVYADPDLRLPGHFGSVRRAYVRFMDRAGTELVKYDLEEGSGIEITAMVFAELYRHNQAWKVRAVGQGYSTGLRGVADDFAVTI